MFSLKLLIAKSGITLSHVNFFNGGRYYKNYRYLEALRDFFEGITVRKWKSYQKPGLAHCLPPSHPMASPRLLLGAHLFLSFLSIY